MKILVVQAAHLNEDGSVFNSSKLMYPGLALPIIAALTPAGHDIKLVNDYYEQIPYDGAFDLVGISAMTPQAPRAYQIASEFRKRGAKVVMGGFHVSLFPEEALAHCDAVVVGEAEPTWGKVLTDVEADSLERVYRQDRLVQAAAAGLLCGVVPLRRDVDTALADSPHQGRTCPGGWTRLRDGGGK